NWVETMKTADILIVRMLKDNSLTRRIQRIDGSDCSIRIEFFHGASSWFNRIAHNDFAAAHAFSYIVIGLTFENQSYILVVEGTKTLTGGSFQVQYELSREAIIAVLPCQATGQ